MKLVIQRVSKGTVKVGSETVDAIDHGLFVLVGVGVEDSVKHAGALSQKLVKMRLMKDRDGKMNLTVKDVGGSFLVVSQFTLYADTSGGNRPSFINAAQPDKAREVYEHFVARLRELGATVANGRFGEYMEIDVKLDGPVTIIVEN